VKRKTTMHNKVRHAAGGLGLMAATLVLALSVPASAAERSLAGIKIFSTTRAIIAKYGSPRQVVVGRPSMTPTAGSMPGMGGGQPGAPSTTPGALPGFGAAPPDAGIGAQPNPSSPGAALGTPGTTTDASNGEVTWIYDRPNGGDLEFTMSSDGRVVQIRATGYKGSVKTSKGIGLGSAYGTVISKYGYPESQDQSGSVLTARYTERSHAAFQFFNQRVVALIVAAVE